jgi:polyisoprenoid-binding protein YceI
MPARSEPPPFFVAVVGGTGSGKSTVAERIVLAMPAGSVWNDDHTAFAVPTAVAPVMAEATVAGSEWLGVDNVAYADLFAAEGESNSAITASDYKVLGDLTIKGITKGVELDLEFNGVHPDPWGGTRAGFSAETEISRKEFGIDFEVPMDGGGVVVGDKIKILLEVEAVLQAA